MSIINLLAICLTGIIFIYIGVPFLYSQYAKLMLKKNAIKSKALVITFDDGPGSRLTPVILDVLAKTNVKATFFILGRNIPAREHIVRRIMAEGHEIGSHGFDHLHAWKVWPWQSIMDIKSGWQAIDQALGVQKETYPFRPPYGKLNLATLLYLSIKKVPIIYWTMDIMDTWSEEKRKKQINREWTKLLYGAVLLAHDFDRTNTIVDAMAINSISQALATARELGLKTLTALELLGLKE